MRNSNSLIDTILVSLVIIFFKRGNDKSKPKSYGKDQHMHKGVGVKIFNKFEELPWEDYKIDYSYYIAKANTLINELEKDIRQLTLF